jgi:uncharacterized protein (TIGR02145 family)
MNKMKFMLMLVAAVSLFFACGKEDEKGGNNSNNNNNNGNNNGSSNPYLNPNLTYGSITDIDGNTYATIEIDAQTENQRTTGTQIWMAENLKTTRYNDGTEIPNITDDEKWKNDTAGAWCYYDNNQANNAIYGKLYNWYAVNTGKLCPKGWRMPTNEDWDILATNLGGTFVDEIISGSYNVGWYTIAGGKMVAISTLWGNQNTNINNSSGFTGLPGGIRRFEGTFTNMEVISAGAWWSTTETNTRLAWYRELTGSTNLSRDAFEKTVGMSCRCIKD